MCLIIKKDFNLFITESYLYKSKGYKINKQLRRYMKDINAQEYELLSSEAPVVMGSCYMVWSL